MMKEIVLVQKAVSKVFGDFVAKAVSDSVDVLKSAIKDADLDRKSYNQNLQTRLYQLIVDALNRFTYNKYEKQDKLYDAAESIIKGYIRTNDNVDAVKVGLKILVSDVNNDTCQEFLETVCGEICRDDNSDLYKKIDILWKRRESEYFRGEFAKIDQNDREMLEHLNDLKDVLGFIKRNMNRQEEHKAAYYEIFVKNRAGEYADKWNKNVFLNNFNKRDKNAGVNIKLQEIYPEKHLPHYKWKADDESLDDLKDLLKEYIIDNNEKKMLLILGQPGIGKSTLITWIMVNLLEKKDGIYVYQFSSDLENIDWQGKNVLDNIFSIIGLKYDELEGKTLILDGFDEIYVNRDRERILHNLNQELQKKNFLKTFSIIITCRKNYVDKKKLEGIEYITLQAWNKEQMRSFCEIYEEEIIRKGLGLRINKNMEVKINKIIETKDIMGIPLILYMVLALDVDIERSSSVVDIYDQVFSLKRGGIYDREYDVEHRINEPETKSHIHRISQKIAFWMFENNADEATISQGKFEEICDNEMRESGEKGEGIQRDTLIGNFFRFKYCEGKGTDELQFIHRSIYEYFVVIYFFESIYKLKSIEEVAGKLGEFLKAGCLSKQILEFIKIKFDSMKGVDLPDIIKKIFDIMLNDGMTYHTNIVSNDGITYHIKEQYRNIMNREMNIFTNMLEVVHLWNLELGEVNDNIVSYLQYNNCEIFNLVGIKLRQADLFRTNLNGANLSKADLSEANLGEANLIGANLTGANLSGAYLSGTNLSRADISEVNLSRANLVGANLVRANLSKTNLSEADLSAANLTGANLSGADLNKTIFYEEQVEILHKKYDLSRSNVLTLELEEIISYREYCLKKARLKY